MKKLLLFLIFCFGIASLHAQRYVSEIFSDVTVLSDVVYAGNVTIITGMPGPDTLKADWYMPAGDTVTNRPLVVYVHTGNFLPQPLNGSATGSKLDYTAQTICTRLAKMGYVAAAITYRTGWDPLNTEELVRRATLIQAAYRGVQDFRTFLRYARLTVDSGNPYGIDGDKIAGFGEGTGGYVVMAAATLDAQEEIKIPKFQNPVTGDYFIDEALLGNLDGDEAGLINVPNHVGYSSDFSFSFNAGGALGDISWLDDGNIPIASAHVVKDPFAPFGIDPMTGMLSCELPVIVPTTLEFVVNVAGSKCLHNEMVALGLNTELDNADLSDNINTALAAQPFAGDHLWAVARPSLESGPWAYWDSTYWKNIPHPLPQYDNFHEAGLATNPDMSMEKANAYIDTLISMFAPRAATVLGVLNTNVKDNIKADLNITVSPNPATHQLMIQSESGIIDQVEIYNLSGQKTYQHLDVQNRQHTIISNDMPPGIYILKVKIDEKLNVQRVVIE